MELLFFTGIHGGHDYPCRNLAYFDPAKIRGEKKIRNACQITGIDRTGLVTIVISAGDVGFAALVLPVTTRWMNPVYHNDCMLNMTGWRTFG